MSKSCDRDSGPKATSGGLRRDSGLQGAQSHQRSHLTEGGRPVGVTQFCPRHEEEGIPGSPAGRVTVLFPGGVYPRLFCLQCVAASAQSRAVRTTWKEQQKAEVARTRQTGPFLGQWPPSPPPRTRQPSQLSVTRYRCRARHRARQSHVGSLVHQLPFPSLSWLPRPQETGYDFTIEFVDQLKNSLGLSRIWPQNPPVYKLHGLVRALFYSVFQSSPHSRSTVDARVNSFVGSVPVQKQAGKPAQSVENSHS